MVHIHHPRAGEQRTIHPEGCGAYIPLRQCHLGSGLRTWSMLIYCVSYRGAVRVYEVGVAYMKCPAYKEGGVTMFENIKGRGGGRKKKHGGLGENIRIEEHGGDGG